MRGGCHPSLSKKETLLSQHLGVERPQGKCHSEHRCHSRPVGSTPPPGLLLSRSRSASQRTNQHHPSLPPPTSQRQPHLRPEHGRHRGHPRRHLRPAAGGRGCHLLLPEQVWPAHVHRRQPVRKSRARSQGQGHGGGQSRLLVSADLPAAAERYTLPRPGAQRGNHLSLPIGNPEGSRALENCLAKHGLQGYPFKKQTAGPNPTSRITQTFEIPP